MERAPSRAKATNILRPASRAAQGPAVLSPDGAQQQSPANPPASSTPQAQTTRVLAGGARLLLPTSGPMQPQGGFMPGMMMPAGMPLNSPGMLRRAPSAAQMNGPMQPLDMSQAFLNSDQQQQQPPLSAGGPRQRMSAHFEPSFSDPSMAGQTPARTVSRSGSRAELGSMPNLMQQQQQQQQQQQPFAGQQQPFMGQQLPPRSSSRSGFPAGGMGPAGMWGGPLSAMGMNNFFGGGFGSMGGDAFNPASPMGHAHPMMMMPAGGRPGSSLQMASHPARPATSTGYRNPASSTEQDGPVVVNVARGGARVIGPMRGKSSNADQQQPSFLNPIPQSPSSALGGALIPEPHGSRERVLSALSGRSYDSARSNSLAHQPTEESMEAAEARVSRKIQDLEISNKSLLAVNTQLEAQVKAQREQIAELKKQAHLKMPFSPDIAADADGSDKALRSALKEDKVFERLISNLEHLIQDAKDALEYRSTVAAGKVISAAELNEDGSQLTVGKGTESQLDEGAGEERTNGADEKEESDEDEDNSSEHPETADKQVKTATGEEASNTAATATAAADVDAEREAINTKLQEARELVAKLMVLALSASSEPTTPVVSSQVSADKPVGSRIPRRTGSTSTGAAAAAAAASAMATPSTLARPGSAMKGGMRNPAKSASTRISSFGVASANTPVRSLVVSPTPSGKASSIASADSKDAQGSSTAEKEQILDICRKLQQIL